MDMAVSGLNQFSLQYQIVGPTAARHRYRKAMKEEQEYTMLSIEINDKNRERFFNTPRPSSPPRSSTPR